MNKLGFVVRRNTCRDKGLQEGGGFSGRSDYVDCLDRERASRLVLHLADGRYDIRHGDVGHAFAVKLARIPTPAGRARDFCIKVRIAYIARLPRRLTTAKNDYTRTLDCSGEMHQKSNRADV